MTERGPRFPGVPADGGAPEPRRGLKPTGWRELVAIALAVGVAVWIVVRSHYGSLPSVPLLAGGSLYVLAAIETPVAFVVRSRVAGGRVGIGAGRMHPITVARAVALAKASALLGAFAVGVFGGLLVFLLSERSTLTAAQHDMPGAALGLVGALLLVAAALWLERCCRTPDDPDEQPTDASPA
ncbi:DUF3180 domain-containing protein [Tsukamurella soli]|uniref:DUF3180 domain-containing protein n=1 Tax=Tsukamurella soli TaxID=644556 RepID=A0ABP8J3W8_9ACTN